MRAPALPALRLLRRLSFSPLQLTCDAGPTAATGIANGMEAVNKAVAKAADAASATCAGREVAGKAT